MRTQLRRASMRVVLWGPGRRIAREFVLLDIRGCSFNYLKSLFPSRPRREHHRGHDPDGRNAGPKAYQGHYSEQDTIDKLLPDGTSGCLPSIHDERYRE